MEARPSTREGGTSLGWLCSVNKGKAFEEFGITLKPAIPETYQWSSETLSWRGSISCHIKWRERQGEMREKAHRAEVIFVMMSRQVTVLGHIQPTGCATRYLSQMKWL